MSVISILLVEDHAIVRTGLCLTLKAELPSATFEQASSVEEALPFIHSLSFDLVLLDLFLPGRHGLELLREMRNANCMTPVLVLTAHEEALYAIRAIQAGADGYLTKNSSPTELNNAVHSLLSGQRYIGESVAQLLAQSCNSYGGLQGQYCLSMRELDVLHRIASGMTVTQIAQTLNLSTKTVSTYRARLMKKLRLRNNAEIINYAFKHGLISALPSHVLQEISHDSS